MLHLNEEVDQLEGDELVVVHIDARHEEERRIPLVYDLLVPPLDEVAPGTREKW